MLRVCAVTAILLLLSASHSAAAATSRDARGATQERDTSCDDGTPLRASCSFPLTDDLEIMFRCGSAQLLAQQLGCFRCVDPVTCKREHDHTQVGVLPPAHNGKDAHTAPLSSPGLTSADNKPPVIADKLLSIPVESDVAGVDLPYLPDALSTAESAAFNAASVQSGGRFARQEVSNWYFLAPAVLAMVSLGIAVRSRVIREREARFERMDACEQSDEINPFCENVHNPQDDDGGVEFAGRFVVDHDDDEDDEEEDDHSQVGRDLEADVGRDSSHQTVDNDSGFAIVVSSSPSVIST